MRVLPTGSPTHIEARRRWLRSAAVSVALGMVAFIAGLSYLTLARRSAVPFIFNQAAFGPAVMEACGRGFVNPLPPPTSALAKFLAQETSRFDCNELGPNVAESGLSPYQLAERYSLAVSAGVWKIAGVTWSSLDVIAAAFAALTIALVYLTFHLVLPLWLSAALALLWLTSPAHLYFLTALRDYSKAPFFVLTILVIETIVLRSLSNRKLIAMSALLGAAIGIGFGFRTDVVLNLVPFVIAVTLFAPGGVLRRAGRNMAAVAACIAAFWICARPVIKVYQGGHNLWHVSLLGLMDPFDRHLGVSPAVYSFGNAYSDDLVETIVKGYGWRVQPDMSDAPDMTPEYERMTRGYFLELARTFPADFAIRSWASVVKVLNLPFSIAYGVVPNGVTASAVTRVYRVRAWVLTAAEGITPIVLCALLFVLVGGWPRYALALASILMFFAAYPVLQYDGRHVFHLEFLALWIIGVSFWGLWSNTVEVQRLLSERASVRRMLLTMTAITILVVAPIAVLRRYQTAQVSAVLAEYAHAHANTLTVKTMRVSDGTARLSIDMSMSLSEKQAPIVVQMVAVEVSPAAPECKASAVDLNVMYLQRDNSTREDYSHLIRVPVVAGAAAPSVAYVPVYVFAHNPYVRFVGFELPSAQTACIARVSRLGPTARTALLLETVVARDGNGGPLYQQLSSDSEIAPPHIRSAIKRLSELWKRDRGSIS